MRTHILHRRQRLRGTPAELFPCFGDVRDLERVFDRRASHVPPLLGG